MAVARHAEWVARGRVARKASPLAALALLAAVAGCAHKSRIAGTINTINYVIPAGQVVTAVGDVTINASRRIEIDGVLDLAPGATITFKSPLVNIPGTVQNQEMYVGWWRRSKFLLNRLPGMAVARIDRLLGRSPNYWARGALDCFNPAGRAASLSAPAGNPPQKSDRSPAS